MTTALAKQLSARMKAKNINVTALEREAGLNTHAALNILRGKSKEPSAKILYAIANVLGCTIPDLLDNKEIFQPTETTNADLFNAPYDNPHLLQEVITVVNDKVKNEKVQLTRQQAITCVEEIYLNSLQRNLETIDPEFTEWFFGLLKR